MPCRCTAVFPLCVNEASFFFHLYLHGEALQCYTVGEACRVRYSVELERREGETKGNY